MQYIRNYDIIHRKVGAFGRSDTETGKINGRFGLLPDAAATPKKHIFLRQRKEDIMLAQRPPMGWNSWNTFGENISEELIMGIADAMVEKGLRDAGYEYIVIDDCWSLRERGEEGRLVADPKKLPQGM